MSLGIVILSFNSSRYMDRCVRCAIGSARDANLEVIVHVVENGSTDGSVDILRGLQLEFGASLTVTLLDRNYGTTVSRNLALRALKVDHVLVLDSDAYMTTEALVTLVAHVDSHASCGIAAPRLTFPDGRHQMSTDVFPTILRKVQRAISLRELESAGSSIESGLVDYAISACWLMRSDVVKRVGLLDERIFYSPEDVDYCIRVWLAGYEVHLVGDASIVHDAQEKSRGKGLLGINHFTIRHARGLVYLFLKHRYGLSRGGLLRRIRRVRRSAR